MNYSDTTYNSPHLQENSVIQKFRITDHIEELHDKVIGGQYFDYLESPDIKAKIEYKNEKGPLGS